MKRLKIKTKIIAVALMTMCCTFTCFTTTYAESTVPDEAINASQQKVECSNDSVNAESRTINSSDNEVPEDNDLINNSVAQDNTGIVENANVESEEINKDITPSNQDQSGFSILNYITIDELKQMGIVEPLPDNLKNKLDMVLNSVIVDNSLSKRDDKTFNNNPILGNFIRIVSWNIERGFPIEDIKNALSDPDYLISRTPSLSQKKADIIRKEIQALKAADIIIINEVDIGMPRTEYKNIAKEFADIFGYNYAYGVEFLEVDPARFGEEINEWSEEKFIFKDKELKIEPEKFKGMHGSAIVSRYRLNNVRIIRLPNVYDWYNTEKKPLSGLEVEKRFFARDHLKSHILKEIRRGGRMALVADVNIPDFGDPVTIVATHLENRASPSARKEQMLFLLDKLKDVNNPLILAGDLNTSGHDASPITLSKEVKEVFNNLFHPIKCLQQFVDVLDYGLYYIEDFCGIFWQYTDPTQINIPVINHNAERKVFKAIKNFEFSDGYVFDFRGARKFSVHQSGRLSNSNQRCFSGFKPTYILRKNFYKSRFKLDWIFVKSYLSTQKETKENFQFAPLFGKVYYDLNYYNKDTPLSDHTPISVDLPLNPLPVLDKEQD